MSFGTWSLHVVCMTHQPTSLNTAGPPAFIPAPAPNPFRPVLPGRRPRDGMPDPGTAIAAAPCPWVGTHNTLSPCRASEVVLLRQGRSFLP